MLDEIKDEVAIEKTRLETRILAQQLTPSYQRQQKVKTVISASGLIIALVSVIGGFVSVANWFIEQRSAREIRAEERLDRALTLLADENPGKRLAGVISLRSFTGEQNELLNTQVLQALSGRLALEESSAVRNAILFSIEDVDPKIVNSQVLNRALQSLAETSRTLVQSQNAWSTRPAIIVDFEEDPKGEALRATAQALVALLRKGARTRDLSGVYLGASDLTALDLSGTSFDDAILADTNFTEATLAGASFNGADLAATKFIRADLRKSKFTLSQDMGRFGRHRDYIESQMERWPAADSSKYLLQMPKFDCSDLRGADFKGHALFFLQVNHYQWPAPTLVENAPDFRGANLKETDMREIHFVQISPTDLDSAFPTLRGFGNELRKGYDAWTYQIDAKRPLVPSNSEQFSQSLGMISFKFRGSNWSEAHLPRAVREEFEKDPPPKDQYTPDPCIPRAM